MVSKGAGRKGGELKERESQKARISSVKCDGRPRPCVLGAGGIRP